MIGRRFSDVSRIGFGCASLGSRIPAAMGLAALARAFDAGVNWFDLAPSYGDGTAETIFAQFARGRRNRIHICTKCGIAPAAPSGVKQLLKPLAQRAVAAAPALRAIAARGRAAPKPLPLTPEMVHESLDASLRRLNTDHVEVLALHDPEPESLGREELLRAIKDILQAGKARAAGIAGSVEAAVTAMRAGLPITHVQIPDPPFAEFPVKLAASMPPGAGYFLATHSIFGRADPLRELLSRTNNDRRALAALLVAHGYEMPLEAAARAVLFDHALAANPDGVVLLSMFTPQHAADNLARLREENPGQARAFFGALNAFDTGGAHSAQQAAPP